MRRNNWAHLGVLLLLTVGCGVAITTLLQAETPYGRVTGVLTLKESGVPLPGVRVELDEDTKGNRPHEYLARTDAHGRFTIEHVAVGTYKFYASADAHEVEDVSFTVREDATTDASTALKPIPPYLSLQELQRVYTTPEQVALRIHGFVPEPALALTLYRFTAAAAPAAWNGWLPDHLTLGRKKDIQTANLDTVPELRRVRREQVPITQRDIEGVFRRSLGLGTLPPGTYLLSAQAGAVRDVNLVCVTDLGLVVKRGTGKVLAYAVDLRTGAPKRGVNVEVRVDDAVSARRVTDDDGLCTLPEPRGGEDDNTLLVVAHDGDHMAVTASSLYGGDGEGAAYNCYTYTDRPIYRPGHTVSFKSIIRRIAGKGYRVPPQQDVAVQVNDNRDNRVYEGTVRSTAFGSVNGAFTLPDAALPGMYGIDLTVGGEKHYGHFQVAEYRKPEFTVSVTPVRKRYSRGDVPEFTVNAAYYFGGPVGGAKVSYEITREPSWYYEQNESWDDDLPDSVAPGSLGWGSEEYEGGEIVTSGKGRLDDAGKLVVRAVPDDTIERDDEERPAWWNDDTMDWRYMLRAYVTDEAEREEEGRGDVAVTQGDVRLHLGADYLARPGTAATVDVQVVDYDGKPVPKARGEATLERLDWTRHTEIATPQGSTAWQADAAGKGTVTFTPATEGSYRVKVVTRDARGRRIAGTQHLWVMTDDGGGFAYPFQDLDVRADKRIYREGDTARIIINTKHVNRQALLTFESDDALTYRMLTLTKASTIVKVPVTADLLPNISVGVCFVEKKQFHQGEAMINVSRVKKALQVTVTPDKPKYQPGEVAEFRVKTTTANGTPASAEVSLGLVDEAIYALAEDDAENIVANFYPRRYNAVRTTFSFPEIYLSGDDKGGGDIHTRANFLDTAYWNPQVVTDAAGEATISVPLPDNLTTWRATVRAATSDTLVGQGRGALLVTKPFLVRLEVPRFLTSGDLTNIAVVAHNNTDDAVTAQVGLGGKGVQVDGAAAQRVTLAPGQAKRCIWRVRANEVGQVELRGWGQAAENAKLADAMALTLPVKLQGRPEADAYTGRLTSNATLRFTRAQRPVPGSKTLTIRLAPSPAAALFGALEYLAKYPYGCTEQTMSCFLPDVLVAGLLKQAGTDNAKLRAELPKMVAGGLSRLYAYQHYEGGWGWWEHDDDDPWMTAYVLFGLLQARQAGYAVSPGVYDQAVSALRTLVVVPELTVSPDKLAFAAWVTALAGHPETARTALANLQKALAGPKPPRMRGWNWSALALAQGAAGLDSATALRRAWSAYDDVRANRVETDYWYDTYQRGDEAAMLLLATATLAPDDSRAPALVDVLMAQREGNHWDSTRATAFTLLAMTRYLSQSRELHPDETVGITVNGTPLATVHFGPADVFKPERVFTLDAAALGDAPPVVALSRTGSGQVYYTAVLDYVEQDNLRQPAAGTGDLAIERSYRRFERRAKPGVTASHFTIGDTVEVTLTITAKRPFRYVMIEDPLPAGCEPRDRGVVDSWEWNYWWTNQVVRDDRTGFAVRYLSPGKPHTITYRIHAAASGSYTALPPRVFDMYNAAAWASGTAQMVTIGE
jgi:uncharacterized protein YfaS (alpha-2-macroglobulin family)